MAEAWDVSSAGFIKKVVAQDAASIERLVRAYTRHLHNAAVGMGFDPETAKEMVQDTWITFYEKVPAFEGRSSVRTFIFAILYRKGLEKCRELAKLRKHDPVDDVVAARFDLRGHWVRPPASPEEFVLAAETSEKFHACLEKLPLTQRAAFTLKEVDDLESEEICNTLGITVTNLGVLLYRARNRLRECLEVKSGWKS